MRVAIAVGVILAGFALGPSAEAQEAAPTAAPAPPAVATSGIAVVALSGATDAAWPLAQLVYGTPSLRPPALDEVHARILCGEAPGPGATQEARDLADSLAAVKGEDAPSRTLLGEIGRRLNVRALAVVKVEAGHPMVRVFLTEAGVFDAASYTPDPGSSSGWTGTVRSLSRAFGAEPAGGPTSAPSLATHEEPVVTVPPPKSKAFYESGWFWGALGAAAFAGGAIFFATRDNGESTIHLQVQVPH
jgi:hypothetical protein